MNNNKEENISHYLYEYIGDDHAENPFLMNTKFKVLKAYSERRLLDPSEFKAEEGIILPKSEAGITQHKTMYSYLFDQERSCKVYQVNSRGVIDKLTGHAPTLFLHLICHLTYGSDKIKFDVDKYSKVAGVSSKKTVYTALKVLRDAGILAKHTKPNIYWINPHILFTGHRINKFPDHLEITEIGNK